MNRYAAILLSILAAGSAGASVPRAATIVGCRAILDGLCDEWAESSLYMVGTLDDARNKEASAQGPGTP